MAGSLSLISALLLPTFSVQCADDRKYFTLPNEIFLLNLPSSAFMVYAYLLLIEDRRTHTCHPSYNTIAHETGMTKNTVMKNISALLDAELITMEHSSYFDKLGMKWKGNNLYTIQPIQQVVVTREAELLAEMKCASAQRKWDEKYKSSTPAREGNRPKDRAEI